MEIGKKIKQLRKERGWIMKDLAKKTSTSVSTISQWESGQTRPTYDKIEALASIFGVPLSVLLDDEEMIMKSVSVPVLGRVQAGVPAEAVQEIIDYEEIDRALAIKGQYFALKIRGRSMLPTMRPNDVVIVQKQETVENGQVAVVLVNGDDATVKKVLYQENGIMLMPFNPDFSPIFYTSEQIENLPVTIIGRVIECRQKY